MTWWEESWPAPGQLDFLSPQRGEKKKAVVYLVLLRVIAQGLRPTKSLSINHKVLTGFPSPHLTNASAGFQCHSTSQLKKLPTEALFRKEFLGKPKDHRERKKQKQKQKQ